MPQPKLIDPRRERTPIETGAPSFPRQLPADVLKDASRRLGILGLVGVVLWLTAPALYHLSLRAMGMHETIPGPVLLVSGLGASLSLMLYLYTRSSTREPRFILDLGLVYLILVSFGIGLIWHVRTTPLPEPEPNFTWVGPLVLLFAAIIPNSPLKILTAGLISASMPLIGMVIVRDLVVTASDAWRQALLMHFPDFMLVGLAVVIARVVAGLGQEVAKARELGSDQLGELLGEGGMGQVYRATHRFLARPAAIKLIRPEMVGAGNGDEAASDVAIKRFKREAMAAANLRSPHTVELYDFGVTDDRTFYFAMELLEGMSLDELVRRTGPLPAERVIHILAQVCESLEEAHARGLVHRDIKPANIHLGRLGLRHDFVKVLDFGLVKSTQVDEGDRSLATAAGLTPGTPAFMAPEMALGETVDGRADLYALGCVGYYLLTGRPVFEGDNAMQVLAKHLNANPVPPSKHSTAPIPAELERIILACLAKDPAYRPASAGVLAEMLAAVPAPEWGERQAAAWWRSHAPS
jgi:serine/threonine-protein kinase